MFLTPTVNLKELAEFGFLRGNVRTRRPANFHPDSHTKNAKDVQVDNEIIIGRRIVKPAPFLDPSKVWDTNCTKAEQIAAIQLHTTEPLVRRRPAVLQSPHQGDDGQLPFAMF